jgi:glycerol kinase
MDASERDHLYARWQQAVERSRGWARVEGAGSLKKP